MRDFVGESSNFVGNCSEGPMRDGILDICVLFCFGPLITVINPLIFQ